MEITIPLRVTSEFHLIFFCAAALFGLVQTEPVQSQTASLGPGPVRPSGWTGPDWWNHCNQISGERLEGIGEWLLAKTEYRDWRASSVSKILLLRGIRR
jgi:hypothetical protein